MANSTSRYDIATDITDDNLYGKNVYLIGTSEFGPTNKPTLIEGQSQLRKTFGVKGSLIEGFNNVFEVAPDAHIFLVKTTGTDSVLHLNVNVKGGSIVEDGLIIKAKDSNELYNNLKVVIADDSITFFFPEELGGGSKQYVYADYEIMALLVRQINNDTAAGENMVYAQCAVEPSTPIQGSLSTVNPDELYLYGGDSGLSYNKNQYFYCLNDTYSFLEGESVDIVIPLEAYMDDLHPRFYSGIPMDGKDYLNIVYSGNTASYYAQLLMFCLKQARFGLITHGIIGFGNLIMPGSAKLIVDANDTIKDLADYEFLVSIVGGGLNYGSGTTDNGYTAYAGLLSSLIKSANTTNAPFPKSIELGGQYSEEEIEAFADIGIVTFRTSPLYNCVVVCNGVTSAPTTTELHYICNIRMIQVTMAFVKKLFDLFVGEDASVLLGNNVIDLYLTKLLNYLKSKTILDDYAFQLIRNDEIGVLTVYLDLKTRYMIEAIRTVGNVAYQVR